jgi:hypothetical protein
MAYVVDFAEYGNKILPKDSIPSLATKSFVIFNFLLKNQYKYIGLFQKKIFCLLQQKIFWLLD